MNRRSFFKSVGGLGSMSIASLFSDAPAGPSQDLKYRSGVVVEFNQVTLENVVNVGGADLTNLPILGVGEATLLTPGSVVGLIVIGDEGHAKSYAIIGRLVTPNSEQADEAVSLLSSHTQSATVNTLESTTTSGGAFGDLATVGPTLSNVRVGPSGRLLVICSAFCFGNATDPLALMHFALSGGNTRSPNANEALTIDYSAPPSTVLLSASRVTLVEGLTASPTTVTAKYAAGSSPGSVATFQYRNITTISL